MCNVGARCAGDTRGPHKKSTRNYYAAQGRLARCVPDITPLASVDAAYEHSAAMRSASKAQTVASSHMSVAALTGDAKQHLTPGKHAVAAAGHRAAGSAAMTALTHLHQNRSLDSLRDPLRSRAATASASHLGRTTGHSAVSALAVARQAPAPVARLRDPQLAHQATVTHAASARIAAGGAASALAAMKAKGWSNPNAGVALV